MDAKIHRPAWKTLLFFGEFRRFFGRDAFVDCGTRPYGWMMALIGCEGHLGGHLWVGATIR
jgi:hypothetical protein